MGGLFTIQSVSDTILHRSFCTSQSIEQSKDAIVVAAFVCYVQIIDFGTILGRKVDNIRVFCKEKVDSRGIACCIPEVLQEEDFGNWKCVVYFSCGLFLQV